MGVEGCTKCIKYMLFFLNFIFWLAGGVILGVALWLRNDGKISSLMTLELEGVKAPSAFYICVHIMIAVGAVMMVVGFLGCYGAIQESQCLLATFFICLVILFACEVAGGIWGYMNRETVSMKMKEFYDGAYDQAITATFVDQEKKTAVSQVLKVFHETLNCCGKGLGSAIFTQFATDICPGNFKSENCHKKIDELFSDRISLIGIAALVVALIMILEMIFSMVLCCGIRNSPVY